MEKVPLHENLLKLLDNYSRQIGGLKGKRILAVGDNSGFLTYYLQNKGAIVTGVDKSGEFHNNPIAEELKHRLIKGNVLNFKPTSIRERFDLIVSNAVMSIEGLTYNWQRLRVKSLKKADIATIKKMREIAQEKIGPRLHEKFYALLRPGGAAIHSSYSGEPVEIDVKKIRETGYEILHRSAQGVVLKKRET